MNKKLSLKQRKEVITKGSLCDILDEKDYVSKEYLNNVLDEKGYVTKSFLMNEFKTEFKIELETFIENSFKRHVRVLMEDNHDTVMTLIEAFQNRFEKIEEKLGLKY